MDIELVTDPYACDVYHVTICRPRRGHILAASRLQLVLSSDMLEINVTAHWCLSSGFCTCMEQFAVIRQECAVADVVPSRSEDCTVSVVVRSSLGDRNCTIYCNYCLPAATGYQPFCLFLFLLVSDCAVPLQCL